MSSRVRRSAVPLAAMLLVLVGLDGCRLITQEILCRRDRDCPELLDGGEAYCTSWDAGIGICVADDEYDGDFKTDDIDTDPVLPSLDGGLPEDGGLPGFPIGN